MGSRQPRRYADLSRPRTRWNLTVELPEDGMRLDRFMAKRVRWRSRTELQAMIDDRQVALNAETQTKASRRLRTGDQVVILIPVDEDAPDPAAIPIDVLVEDEALLAVNKRPGIVVHPTGGHTLTNVLSALHARYRDIANPANDRVPHICHRIDRETSGVLLFAFSERWKADISMQFERREVQKEYLALVHGCPATPEGLVDAPILHRRVGWPRLVIDDGGLPSSTSWRVEEDYGDAALVRFFPHTGRTHQIRVHAAHVGHPLLCDDTYGGTRPITAATFGGDDEAILLERVALHSARLAIRHPVTHEPMAVEAPLPADLARVVAFFRGRA